VNSGDSIGSSNMPSEPSKSGHTFDGWYTALNGGGMQFTAATTVTADITVYARWTAGSNSSGISNITYSSVSGGEWTLLADGRRQSPVTADNGITKARVSFTGGGSGVSITIQLEVSSEAEYDFAFIGELDNPSAAYDSGYYSGSLISGEDSVTISIPVPTAGSHFVDIGYSKDGSAFGGSDCAWFKVITGASGGGEVQVPATTLAAALAWLDSNAAEDGAYTITLNANETIGPNVLSYGGKNLSITIKGDTTERTVSLSSTGSLFRVENGVTLTLDSNITLQGRSDNTAEIVQVNSGGTLVMKDGAKITGNRSSSGYGSGVGVYAGTFIMDGGTISNNVITEVGGGGAGVYLWPSVSSLSVFNMNGGIITNNTAEGRGAGVLVQAGEFTMSGGEISGNTSGNTSSSSYSYGGGVYVESFSGQGGSFTMSGGTISGNTASYGGGVYVSSGTFTKQSGGVIYGSNAGNTLENTATSGDSYGHAVYVSSSPAKKRNTTAGTGVALDSAVSGSAGGWEETMPDNLSFSDTLTWISNNAVEGGAYTITLQNDESIGPRTLSYSGKTVGLTLRGGSTVKTLSVSNNGSLFTIASGVTLTLDSNITLQGRNNNTSLVRVNSGGTLVMNTGSKISGNTTYSDGGGVYVSGGTFTMSGGTISANTAYYGGGVYVSGGIFTKQSGGVIYGSNAGSTLKNTATSDSYGHAAYVSSGGKKRNSTAGTGVTLDSSKGVSDGGGWE
jgi:uncharacterized repeat protein (TIGR02543 family)